MGSDCPYAPINKSNLFTLVKKKYSCLIGSYTENCENAIKFYEAKDQGETGTCYAYAIAGIILLASKRVDGRAELDFNEIKNKIILNYGEKEGGGYVDKILMNTKLLSEYRLRCKKITINDSIDILLKPNPRPILATFQLSGKEWNSVCNFFKIYPKGILKKEDLINYYNPDLESQSGGHAVIIMGCYTAYCQNGPFYYFNIVNSWGKSWGDKGYFNAAIDATKFTLYDVYWTESDLSISERMHYLNKYPEEFK